MILFLVGFTEIEKKERKKTSVARIFPTFLSRTSHFVFLIHTIFECGKCHQLTSTPDRCLIYQKYIINEVSISNLMGRHGNGGECHTHHSVNSCICIEGIF